MSGKCPGIFPEISGKFPAKFPGFFPETSGNFPGIFREISGKFPGKMERGATAGTGGVKSAELCRHALVAKGVTLADANEEAAVVGVDVYEMCQEKLHLDSCTVGST